MITDKEVKDAIIALRDGECWTWPESDYGRAEIWLKNYTYFLFSIPMYGGRPSFEDAYDIRSIDQLIQRVNTWT